MIPSFLLLKILFFLFLGISFCLFLKIPFHLFLEIPLLLLLNNPFFLRHSQSLSSRLCKILFYQLRLNLVCHEESHVYLCSMSPSCLSRVSMMLCRVLTSSGHLGRRRTFCHLLIGILGLIWMGTLAWPSLHIC